MANNGTATVTITAPRAAINATLASATGLRYRPNFDYNGADTITIAANDQGNTGSGGAKTGTAMIGVTVNPVNDAPRPTPVVTRVTTAEDTAIGGQLTATDPEGDSFTFSSPPEFAPQHGTVVVNADGTWTYTPAANYYGPDIFGYRVADANGASNVGVVEITVTTVNDAPVAVGDSYSMDEDGSLVVSVAPVTRLRMISDPGDFVGDGLTYDFTPATASFSASRNFDNGVSFDVDPPPLGEFWFLDFAGPNEAVLAPGAYLDAMRFPFQEPGRPGLDVSGNGRGLNRLRGQFTVYDVAYSASGEVLRFAATFLQQDHNFDDTLEPPLHGAIVFNSTFGAGGGVLANDTDGEGELLLGATLVSGPAHGTLTFNGDGTFAYTPSVNFHGTDSFTYKASDGTADSNTATVTITVNAINDAPVAVNDSYATDEDVALAVSAPGILGNDTDVDGESLSAALVSGPSNGTLTLNADGSFTYTPNANFHGTDSFTYKANDGALDGNTATVTITVRAVNDVPVASGDSFVVTSGEELAVAGPGVLVNDTDVDGDDLGAEVVSGPAHGSLLLNADGSFVYVPDQGYTGPDSFTYRASDGSLASEATVSIQVNASIAPAAAANVTGSGSTGAGSFTVSVQSRETAGVLTWQGVLVFTDVERGIALWSTSITEVRIESDGVRAEIRGTATVNGQAGYTFTAYIADRGGPGRNDTFQIVITGPGGFLYASADYDADGSLDTGNLKIHKPKKK